MRRHHPAAARSWTLADYTSFDHVTVALLGDGQSEIDAILGASGLSRRTALVTPHFMAALATVSATDMITTISEAFAWRFADTFNLVLRKPPFAETELRMTLVWSNVRTTDPMLAWFRTLVQNVAEDVYANKRRAHQKKL